MSYDIILNIQSAEFFTIDSLNFYTIKYDINIKTLSKCENYRNNIYYFHMSWIGYLYKYIIINTYHSSR